MKEGVISFIKLHPEWKLVLGAIGIIIVAVLLGFYIGYHVGVDHMTATCMRWISDIKVQQTLGFM